MEYTVFRKAALILRSLNHIYRQQIINLLLASESMTVTELFKRLNIEQSVASQHLAILRRSGVVLTKRHGKFIHYSINRSRLREISQMVKELLL